jgi:hypothetical protein
MANATIWAGSSSFFPGDTPFGFYDYEYQFQTDADKVADFCARRLGFPVSDVELQPSHFYTAFEEAITTYGNEVYAYKVRQDYLDVEGASTGSNLNNTLIKPSMASIIRMSQQYGEEAGVGGTLTWYTGSLDTVENQQDYDMNAWAAASASLAAGDSIELKRVFYQAAPAIVRYFDPYAGTGTGMMNLLDTFGWGNYSPAINFLLMPINYDLQKIQAIEFNDQIRKSQYSFELRNNQLRLFPIPKVTGGKLFFEYIKNSERQNPEGTSGVSGPVTNVSNVPYANPSYTQINSIGRQWIFEYTLALSKEMLGYVRGKYTTVPIPGAEVTLNSADLITAATAEKNNLVERLRGYLEETSREKLLERRAAEADYKQKELSQAPYYIYIG